MRLRCERIVSEVLPAVRSVLARELQEQGYSQTEIAEYLDVTQPAVSQYLNASRGKHLQQINEDDSARERLDDLVEAIHDNKDTETLSHLLHDTCLAALAAVDGAETQHPSCY